MGVGVDDLAVVMDNERSMSIRQDVTNVCDLPFHPLKELHYLSRAFFAGRPTSSSDIIVGIGDGEEVWQVGVLFYDRP